MRIIDFHSHYYPPAYLDALRSSPSAVQVSIDQDGNLRLDYRGDYNIVVRGHRDIDYREQVLVQHGIDTQVLMLTTPGTHVETPATAARLASLGNDALASVTKSKHGRFTALATLPLSDPRASVKELQRACHELGFPFDTTLAAAQLVFSGVVERFPRIQWVLCHLGGAIR